MVVGRFRIVLFRVDDLVVVKRIRTTVLDVECNRVRFFNYNAVYGPFNVLAGDPGRFVLRLRQR